MEDISIGICAYNEEQNIGNLLEALLNQRLNNARIKEIIVVASGCTDKTVNIVEAFIKKDMRIKLITEEKRRGKASGVNLFIRNATSTILVLESADTLPLEETIEELIKPFNDPHVGMTGGRPIPQNNPSTFMGFTVCLIWRLHHEIALRRLKLGELVAFRNVIKAIPEDTAVDEACIEAMVKERGHKRVYVPTAIVYNRGPGNLSDLFKQRKRIYIGHLHLKIVRNYFISSMDNSEILKLVLKDMKPNLQQIIWTLFACLLEIAIRISASFDFYIRKRNPYKWEVSASTKKLK